MHVNFGPIVFGLFSGLERYVFLVDVLITLMGLNLQNAMGFEIVFHSIIDGFFLKKKKPLGLLSTNWAGNLVGHRTHL